MRSGNDRAAGYGSRRLANPKQPETPTVASSPDKPEEREKKQSKKRSLSALLGAREESSGERHKEQSNERSLSSLLDEREKVKIAIKNAHILVKVPVLILTPEEEQSPWHIQRCIDIDMVLAKKFGIDTGVKPSPLVKKTFDSGCSLTEVLESVGVLEGKHYQAKEGWTPIGEAKRTMQWLVDTVDRLARQLEELYALLRLLLSAAEKSGSLSPDAIAQAYEKFSALKLDQ